MVAALRVLLPLLLTTGEYPSKYISPSLFNCLCKNPPEPIYLDATTSQALWPNGRDYW